MESKTWLWVALGVGAIVMIVIARGSSGGATLTPLPPQSDQGKVQAFTALAQYESDKLRYANELALGRIQGAIESQRIGAAEEASLYQTQAQIMAAQAQADAQKGSSFLSFLGTIGTAIIAAVA